MSRRAGSDGARARKDGARAVLFDLDGTLADTVADLGVALNRLRKDHGLAALPLESVRPYASSGACGLLQIGFGLAPEDAHFEQLRDAFLDHYEARVCVDTRLFAGIPELLAAIEGRGMAWGIVTNKSSRFTPRIVAALGLEQRAACVVCGDTTPHIKPHPAPLLHAARELVLEPSQCWYVGDDLRDVQAAHSAGMRAVAAAYGYLGTGSAPHTWNAEAVIAQPLDLIAHL
ncbi:MAG: HAD family hydrolase [Betaproteobacteria bacterium]|nr:MAG: HAD family hydrolase [Betaproteobacteria bacterium]